MIVSFVVLVFSSTKLAIQKHALEDQKILNDYPEIVHCDKLRKKIEKFPHRERPRGKCVDDNKCDYDEERSDECYMRIINERLDERLCKKMGRIYPEYQITTDICYETIGVKTNNEALCEKIRMNIPGALTRRESCFDEVAKNKQDSTICEKIQNFHLKNLCYSQIALQKNDISLCRDDFCYSELNKDKNNKAICLKINDSQKRIECLLDTAKVKRDDTICKNYLTGLETEIYTLSTKRTLPANDLCYYNLVIGETDKNKSQNLCGKIRDNFLASECSVMINPCKVLTEPEQKWLTLKNSSFGFVFQYPVNWINFRNEYNEYPEIIPYPYGMIFRDFIFFRTPGRFDDAEIKPPTSYDEINEECKKFSCRKLQDIVTNSVPMKKYFQLEEGILKKYVVKIIKRDNISKFEEEAPFSLNLWRGDMHIGLNFGILYSLYFGTGSDSESEYGKEEWESIISRIENIPINKNDRVAFQEKLIDKIENKTANKCILDTVDMFDKMVSTFRYTR